MRLVILAAGRGIRMGTSTTDIPKVLISIHGHTIIGRLIRSFVQWGVTEIAVVVGYKKEQIIDFIGPVVKGVKVTYIVNSMYATTGTGYSAWLARTFFCGYDSVIIEGDHVLDSRLVGSLVSNSCSDLVMVEHSENELQDDTLIIGSKGLVERMVYPSRTVIGKAVQLVRVGPDSSKILCSELTDLDKECDWVHALNATFSRTQFHYIDTKGLFWAEIDTVSDLEYVREIVKKGLVYYE